MISFAKERLQIHGDSVKAAIEAGVTRFRPVIMTALAMMIGMVPMALGLGEGGEQNAPLGSAVIGGLLCATIATLVFVPSVFAVFHARKSNDVWSYSRMFKIRHTRMSEEHRDAPGTGCALGALLGGMSRASRSAKAVYAARYKRTLAYSTGLVPPNGTSDRRARAILMISAVLGAINLSRAVSDPNLSREILRQTRDQLVSLNKPATPH